MTSEAVGASQSTPWPLAGTVAFDAIDPEWRRQQVEALTRDLRRHAIEPWFPRCVDRENGGFHQSFDRTWRRRPDKRRMLEFQARQTRSLARLGRVFPHQPIWRELAEHGFDYLYRLMRDQASGSWFWLVELDGKPAYGGTKHAHGMSYLLDAAVEVYRLTGAEQSLAAGREAYEWLEHAHHDQVDGGYHGWVTRDGKPILDRAAVPAGAEKGEPLGHAIALKDINVQADVLHAYVALAAAWPNERLTSRIAELYEIVTHRMSRPSGELVYTTTSDWRPVDGPLRFGYSLQLPSRLPVEAELAGRTVEHGLERSRQGVDWVLAHGRDPRGGFRQAAGRAGDRASAGERAVWRERHWWIHTEALRGLLLLALTSGQSPRYRGWYDHLRDFADRELVDRRHGGWHEQPVRDVPLRRRLAGDPPKAHAWKDASHEVDYYLFSLLALRGLPIDAPLEDRPAAG